MRIVLAPMEGLADVYLRRLITAQGGFDWAVSEFVRVVDRRLPDRVFLQMCPELARGGTTGAGTPVRVQLLGNHPAAMAANARAAIALGAYGVDINFGCPSKTVNRSQGGAVLLKSPDALFEVVSAVRRALPADVVVSAKMRLGYADTGLMLDNAAAIEAAGATELTVHARTRLQGYAPPANWAALGQIRDHIRIPLIANGDIWSPLDYSTCTTLAGTPDVMLGRGAVRHPDLAQRIRENQREPLAWCEVLSLIQTFWLEVRASLSPRHCAGRLKQWINHLRQVHPEAEVLWQQVRAERKPERLDDLLLPKGQTPGLAAGARR
ncbi:MAG: tRNA-dihydrouridine synthase [Pseudomonadota bacterium]